MPFLFSYGTLQQPGVQLRTFGRLLSGHSDALSGYRLAQIKIGDPEVVATSGKAYHPIVERTGQFEDRVTGTAFEVTDQELLRADRYEVAAYERIQSKLASGILAWVYVAALSAQEMKRQVMTENDSAK